jgi:hypothetical protein
MWKYLARPSVLMLLAVIQGLSPYLTWELQGKNHLYRYDVTYIPVIIWTVGYASFWVGARLAPKSRSGSVQRLCAALSRTDVNLVLILTLLATIVELVGAIRMYGFLPILEYIRGTVTVEQVNVLQSNSVFGQLGLLTVTLSLLNGTILLLIIKDHQLQRLSWVLHIVALSVAVLGSSMAGKRQGIYMTGMFLLCGISVLFGGPGQFLGRVVRSPRMRFAATGVVSIAALGFIAMTGYMSSLRTGGRNQYSGFQEILAYTQYPLINLEAQCAYAGLGPYAYNLGDIIATLLPARLIEEGGMRSDAPPKPEPNSPSGFYERLHWSGGMLAVVVASLACGFFCQTLYNRANTSLFCLLAYCQVAWALLSAHIYNHFLNLVFVPAPLLAFWLMTKLIDIIAAERGKIRTSTITHLPQVSARFIPAEAD